MLKAYGLKIDISGVQSKDNVPLRLAFTITKRLPQDKVQDFIVNVDNRTKAMAMKAKRNAKARRKSNARDFRSKWFTISSRPR